MTDTRTRVTAKEPSSLSPEFSSEPRWSLATLIAFRFFCAYFVLEWLPLTATLNVRPLTLGMVRGPDWFYTLNIRVGMWVITHFLGLPEHSAPSLSANPLHLFLGMVGLAAISAVVALAWTAFDRRRVSHRCLFAWVHTFVRFILAAIMLLYGWHKVLPAQFNFTFDYLTLDVGQHNPRDLLWAFMGASRPYQVFTGLVEVGGGLLLLTRRTAMLGGLVSMAAMANVLVLNIAYDVIVKFLASQIFLMTLFVLAPFAIRLVGTLVLDHETHPAQVRRLFGHTTADRVARALGMIFAAWIVYSNFHAAERQVDADRRARQTPLYGIWDVEETIRNGVPVPLLLTDTTLLRRLVVQSTRAAVIFLMPDSVLWYSVQLDSVIKTVQFTPFEFAGTTKVLTFAYVLPDPDHLVLTHHDGDVDAVVVHLRRFDPSNYTLLGWKRSWTW